MPTPTNPQSWNRYSYVENAPLNFSDPTGHMLIEGEGFGGSSLPEIIESPDGYDEDDEIDDAGSIYLSEYEHYDSPCMSLFSKQSCQQISGGISVLVFALDLTSFALSLGGSIFALIGLLGGPVGEGGVLAGYQILNAAEGVIGYASMAIVITNDVLITGETYLTMDPQPEIVLGHDSTVATALALAGGISPEPFSDTIFNSMAGINDLYRLTGGDGLIETHIAVLDLTNSYFSLP